MNKYSFKELIQLYSDQPASADVKSLIQEHSKIFTDKPNRPSDSNFIDEYMYFLLEKT